MKNILIINGHLDKESFCSALAEQYGNSAKNSGADCKLLHIADLDFNPVLQYGYRKRTELEPDLIAAQKAIKEAEHLVFVYPTWWGGPPALLKGFIERVFLPGFAFQSVENSLKWDKHLSGKTARIIATMDAPVLYYKLVHRQSGHQMMQRSVLNFCGVNKVRFTNFGMVKTSSAQKREKWLARVEKLGSKMN